MSALTDTDLMALPPGRHADSEHLQLRVERGKMPRWAHRFREAGKRRELLIGRLDVVSLEQAREWAAELAQCSSAAERKELLAALRDGISGPPAAPEGEFRSSVLDGLECPATAPLVTPWGVHARCDQFGDFTVMNEGSRTVGHLVDGTSERALWLFCHLRGRRPGYTLVECYRWHHSAAYFDGRRVGYVPYGAWAPRATWVEWAADEPVPERAPERAKVEWFVRATAGELGYALWEWRVAGTAARAAA